MWVQLLAGACTPVVGEPASGESTRVLEDSAGMEVVCSVLSNSFVASAVSPVSRHVTPGGGHSFIGHGE